MASYGFLRLCLVLLRLPGVMCSDWSTSVCWWWEGGMRWCQIKIIHSSPQMHQTRVKTVELFVFRCREGKSQRYLKYRYLKSTNTGMKYLCLVLSCAMIIDFWSKLPPSDNVITLITNYTAGCCRCSLTSVWRNTWSVSCCSVLHHSLQPHIKQLQQTPLTALMTA